MPTYEYQCTSCHRRFEVMQSFTDAPMTKCEECGGPLKRIFHPVGVVLKGSGFYATDNRSGKKFTPAKEGGTETKSESKTESKSETKKETSAPAPKKSDSGSSS